jgi:acyl carrier protein
LQVHAIVLLKPGSLPKTSSGKIQRLACRASFLKGEFEGLASWRANLNTHLSSDTALPHSLHSNPEQNAIEQWLVNALATRLGIDPSEIQSDRPVTYYGVDSLMAVDLMHAMETSLDVNVTVADLLQSPSLNHLAARVFNSLQAQAEQSQTPLPPPARPQESPLSYAQRALWFLHELAPESAAYNISAAARIHSRVDVAALQQSLQQLIERHSALRTTFPVEAETPVQRVNDFITINLNEEDVSHLDEMGLAEHLKEETVRPFDLSNGPLLRVSLFKRTAEEYVLLFVAHHTAVDFWSMALLINELGTIYQAQTTGSSTNLAPLAVNYFDYSRSQANLLDGLEGERLWRYWEKQLIAAQTVLNLPIARPRPQVQTYAGANERFHLDKELTRKLKQLSQDYNTTLYTTFRSCYFASPGKRIFWLARRHRAAVRPHFAQLSVAS